MKKPMYALHRNADGAIVTAGSFDYSFKLNDWLKSLDIRSGDKIEFGDAAERPVEEAPSLSVVAQ